MAEKSNGQNLNIKALRFQYRQGAAPHNFETMPFYLKVLRGFLWRNIGKVVWLKGGIIEQPAYLVFTSTIQDEVVKILGTPLADLGKFEITPVSKPSQILQKYVNNLRVAIGWLKLPNLELGSPETVPKSDDPILQKVREGFMLTEYLFIKADDAEVKVVGNESWAILKNVSEMGIAQGSKIAYMDQKPMLGIRTKDLNQKNTPRSKKHTQRSPNNTNQPTHKTMLPNA